MRHFVFVTAAACCALRSLSAQAAGGCPDVEKAARTYIAQNLSDDEEKPAELRAKFLTVAAQVSAVQLVLPRAGEGEGARQPLVLFFAGKDRCNFVYQADGELTEQLPAGTSRYVFIRNESAEGEQMHIDYQVISVRAGGEVAPARDQHGQEIYFSETRQRRCHGQPGDILSWSREPAAAAIIVRQQHLDLDGKCRVIEDASTYRYYTLSADHWILDDGDAEEHSVAAQPPSAPAAKSREHRRSE